MLKITAYIVVGKDLQKFLCLLPIPLSLPGIHKLEEVHVLVHGST